jgi:hypothetical protein
MDIGFIVLAIAFIPAIIYFFLPRHLKQRIQSQVHYFISDFGDRFQSFIEDWQAAGLSKELWELVRDRARAERLLKASRKNYSGKSKKWHLEKIIYDLKRGR